MLVKCLKCNTRAVNMCDDYRSTELCVFIFSKYLRMTDKLLKHVCCSYNVYVAACGRWLRGFWVPEGAGMLHFMRWGSFGVACGGQGGGLFSTNLRRIALKGKWFWREKKKQKSECSCCSPGEFIHFMFKSHRHHYPSLNSPEFCRFGRTLFAKHDINTPFEILFAKAPRHCLRMQIP